MPRLPLLATLFLTGALSLPALAAPIVWVVPSAQSLLN
jgi:hypothetical protein